MENDQDPQGDQELPSLKDLDQRLKQIRQNIAQDRGEDRPDNTDFSKSYSVASRVVIDMLVPPALGFGLGYAFDSYFDTAPWGVLGFIFLGLGAGMMNAYRQINRMDMAVGYRQPDERDKDETKH